MVFSRPTAGLPNDGYEIESRFPQNPRTEASMGRVVFIQSFRGSILLAETKSNIPKGLESSRVEAGKSLYKNDKFQGRSL
ncbi:5-methyltetrahydrofolate--homocysteine methyltransferase [Qipengyuania citrea LAMA 915]|uniref:5-methyltetrahydrofolate--homocysteine methyltransferase n=1 Tax=Qipengyuania citrea LAMA 915 TaxID=1306953 RepID=A0A0L1K9S8_9SPHN|nr:5-methyltetrahydrofolate--homocysteine methyltransferase [Qipengyuania citrea LAMA 915]